MVKKNLKINVCSLSYIPNFRNNSAEKLYGWKDYEVLGRRAVDVLADEGKRGLFGSVTDTLLAGQSWSGQLPMKKRSGEMFMAMVTESLMYEDGELIGVITVTSDAAVFNNENKEKSTYEVHHPNGRLRDWRTNLKKIQWHSQPQIASSVTSLVLMF